MLPLHKNLIVLACALCAVMACSASKAERKASAGDNSAGAPAGDASDGDAQASVDCSKIFTGGDASGILNLPAKVSDYTLRPGSCSFDTANEGGSIKVYGGSDMTSEMTWKDVTGSRDSVRYIPLAGVGDAAVRLKADGTEIDSRKGKVYCSVVLLGIGQSGTETDFTKSRGDELAKKLGALCNKYFASK